MEGRRDRQRVPNGEPQGASRSQEMDVRGWAGQTVKTQVSQMQGTCHNLQNHGGQVSRAWLGDMLQFESHLRFSSWVPLNPP